MIGIDSATHLAVAHSMHREGGIYTASIITSTSPVTSFISEAKSTWAVLACITHVQVGHPHPAPGSTSTSGVVHVTVHVDSIACGALYPDALPCIWYRYLQEVRRGVQKALEEMSSLSSWKCTCSCALRSSMSACRFSSLASWSPSWVSRAAGPESLWFPV